MFKCCSFNKWDFWKNQLLGTVAFSDMKKIHLIEKIELGDHIIAVVVFLPVSTNN